MSFFSSHKQQNSGGTNIQIDNSKHSTSITLNLHLLKKSVNKIEFGLLFFSIPVLGEIYIFVNPHLVIDPIVQYSSNIEMIFIMLLLALSGYVFKKTNSDFRLTSLTFIQLFIPIILQNQLANNRYKLNHVFGLVNNIQFKTLLKDIWFSNYTVADLATLYLFLYTLCFIFLLIAVCSICYSILIRKSVTLFSIIIYVAVTAFLLFGTLLLNLNIVP